ncbi:MAG: O-antigen ligase family protein [Chloroflexi bacterium]|nr:O-antigen ligase family protein [Chloroflexota bacterium]
MPVPWALTGMALMASVSLYPSVDLSLSRPKLYGLILGFYVLAFTVEHARTLRRRRWLAVLLAAGGGATALAGLVGTNWSVGKFPQLDAMYARLPHAITSIQNSFNRSDSGINPNEIGGTLALLLPVALGLALFGSRPKLRWPAVAASVFMGLVLMLTASRSGLLGAAAAVLLLLVLRWRRFAFGLPLIGAGVAAGILEIGPSRIAQSLLALDTATGSSGLGRLEVWDRAWSMIQDFPFTGIGLNTFPLILDTLYPLFSVGPDAQVAHAHDLFLQTAVDLGVLGLVCFLSLLLVAAYSLVRSRGELAFAAGVGAGLLGHLMFSVTDAVALGAKPGVFLWAMLGGAVALNAGRPTKASAWQWAQWVLFALACGLGVFIALTGLTMFPL